MILLCFFYTYFRVLAIVFIRKCPQHKSICHKHKPISLKKKLPAGCYILFLNKFFAIEFPLKCGTLFIPFKVLKCKIILIIMDITYRRRIICIKNSF